MHPKLFFVFYNKLLHYFFSLLFLQLRDSELGAIVNRDLSRRIRSVNGISSHKQVVRADIKLAARIIQNLDRQKKLWDEEEKEEELDERVQLINFL